MRRTISALLAALTIFLAAAPASAATDAGEPSSAAIIFDVLVTRPLGIAATAIGTAVFVAALPFTIPSRSVGVSAEKLIADPFLFTFRRPAGDLDYYTDYKGE